MNKVHRKKRKGHRTPLGNKFGKIKKVGSRMGTCCNSARANPTMQKALVLDGRPPSNGGIVRERPPGSTKKRGTEEKGRRWRRRAIGQGSGPAVTGKKF
ncbi:hypothetical protein GWI33_011430 [Rhynchophorus ferrugineus]|uniref:Uncharacterized protein n=1 Tax=Rhynchophorus ferrugineus TaxID=354439 RepID=A0A834MK32_RHYFE|nr:hypothetical protein GWI33_011430 [Rhynchophorus ferrugineus]